MKYLNDLTQEYLKSILYYDPETGIFTRLIKKGRFRIGDVAGSPDKEGYLQTVINYKNYKVHRLIWLYMTGLFPENEIDHINMIKNDNRWCNLRIATGSQNAGNRNKLTNNTSGYKGVSWHNQANKWLAQINFEKKHISLGLYDKIEDAAAAYEKAAREIHGEFART